MWLIIHARIQSNPVNKRSPILIQNLRVVRISFNLPYQYLKEDIIIIHLILLITTRIVIPSYISSIV